jgi:predicted metalloprotease
VHVAFSAGASSGSVYRAHTNFIFNSIITNSGGQYNKQTGIFICPVDGTYLFSFTLADWLSLTQSGMPAQANLYVGKKRITYAYTYVKKDYVWVTKTVVVPCKKGQQVRVQTQSECELASKGKHSSTFSGVLLHQRP